MASGNSFGTAGSFTIASSGTVSSALDLKENTLVGLLMPSAFTGTTLTFQAATSAGGTYREVVGTDGNAISFTVAAAKYVVIQPAVLAGVRFLKIVSGSAEGAARTVTAIWRKCE